MTVYRPSVNSQRQIHIGKLVGICCRRSAGAARRRKTVITSWNVRMIQVAGNEQGGMHIAIWEKFQPRNLPLIVDIEFADDFVVG